MNKNNILSKVKKFGAVVAGAAVVGEVWQVGVALNGTPSLIAPHFAFVMVAPAIIAVLPSLSGDVDWYDDKDWDDVPHSSHCAPVKDTKPSSWMQRSWKVFRNFAIYTAAVGTIGFIPWNVCGFGIGNAVDAEKEFAHTKNTSCVDFYGNKCEVISEVKHPILNEDDTPKLDKNGNQVYDVYKQVAVSLYQKHYVLANKVEKCGETTCIVIGDTASDKAKLGKPHYPLYRQKNSYGGFSPVDAAIAASLQ